MKWSDRIGQRISPRDLHVFLAVAAELNMAKAAKRLSVSRPVVSRTIASLEHELGVPLFDRIARGTELTRYGAALASHAAVVFDELRRSVAAVQEMATPGTGEVRFASSEIWTAGLVPAAVERVSQRYPRLRFEVEAITPSTLQAYLGERRGEFAITRLTRNAPEPDLEVEGLYQERLVVVAGAGNSWIACRKLRLEQIIQEPWIISPFELDESSPFMKACAAEGLSPPTNRILSNSLNLRAGLLATGRFLTLVPGSVLAFPPWRTLLKPIRVDLPTWQFPTAVFKLKNRTLSAGAEALLSAVRLEAKRFQKTGGASGR
jgi:DNA-binding transcriptional LysR family regulator